MIGVRWPQDEYEAIRKLAEEKFQGDLSFMVRKAVAELMQREIVDDQPEAKAA